MNLLSSKPRKATVEDTERFLKAFASLPEGDPELAHDQADDLLLYALRCQGREDVAAAFERARDRIGFWYA